MSQYLSYSAVKINNLSAFFDPLTDNFKISMLWNLHSFFTFELFESDNIKDHKAEAKNIWFENVGWYDFPRLSLNKLRGQKWYCP